MLLGDNRGTLQKKTTEKVSALMEVALSRVHGTDKVQIIHWETLQTGQEVDLRHFEDGRHLRYHLVQWF